MQTTPKPISIHIPPSLTQYAKPGSVYISGDAGLAGVGVAGLILATDTMSQVHVLLVKRAADDGSLAGLWEPPGGGCETTDPTMIHSTAREVFEESGLHLTGLTDMVGEYRFTTRSGKRVVKFNFVVQVQEIPSSTTPMAFGRIPVEVDPAEHQAFSWVSPENLNSKEYPITSNEQLHAIQNAFELHRDRMASTGSSHSS
jgi:8-oxo-dGTP pyrophosphatase MutT (NUDIX family)